MMQDDGIDETPELKQLLGGRVSQREKPSFPIPLAVPSGAPA